MLHEPIERRRHGLLLSLDYRKVNQLTKYEEMIDHMEHYVLLFLVLLVGEQIVQIVALLFFVMFQPSQRTTYQAQAFTLKPITNKAHMYVNLKTLG